MILVDSSVWTGYFKASVTPKTELLHLLLARERIAIGDLILAEVLQGFASERDFREALRLLSALTIVEIGGRDVAVQAARNFRTLRSLGVTVRKTIDCFIAMRCIVSGHPVAP
jgi:predicted nucleic acid-binding protein